MSRRRPGRPAVAFPTLRSALDLRRASRSEWLGGGWWIVAVTALMTCGIEAVAAVTLFVAVAAAFGAVLVLSASLSQGRAARARNCVVMLIAMLLATIAWWSARHVRVTETQVRGDAIALALERRHLRTGSYPDALAALVPEDLNPVPSTDIGLFFRREFAYARRVRTDDYSLSYKTGIGGTTARTKMGVWLRWR